MKIQLEEFKTPQLTPEENAYTAGYMAACKSFQDNMVEQGIWNPDWNWDDYDHYLAAMAEYFNKSL